jgi:hypothetical protein
MKTSTGRTEEEAEPRAEEEEAVGLRAPPVQPQVLPPVRTGWYCLHRGSMFFYSTQPFSLEQQLKQYLNLPKLQKMYQSYHFYETTILPFTKKEGKKFTGIASDYY